MCSSPGGDWDSSRSSEQPSQKVPNIQYSLVTGTVSAREPCANCVAACSAQPTGWERRDRQPEKSWILKVQEGKTGENSSGLGGSMYVFFGRRRKRRGSRVYHLARTCHLSSGEVAQIFRFQFQWGNCLDTKSPVDIKAQWIDNLCSFKPHLQDLFCFSFKEIYSWVK